MFSQLHHFFVNTLKKKSDIAVNKQDKRRQRNKNTTTEMEEREKNMKAKEKCDDVNRNSERTMIMNNDNKGE